MHAFSRAGHLSRQASSSDWGSEDENHDVQITQSRGLPPLSDEDREGEEGEEDNWSGLSRADAADVADAVDGASAEDWDTEIERTAKEENCPTEVGTGFDSKLPAPT